MSEHQESEAEEARNTSPEALESESVAWYGDLDMTTVVVAGFISTVLTVLIIAVVQGLYYQWQFDAIRRVGSETYISPAESIVQAQKETLTAGALPTSLTGGEGSKMYYPMADQRVLISLDDAKDKVIAEMAKQ